MGKRYGEINDALATQLPTQDENSKTKIHDKDKTSITFLYIFGLGTGGDENLVLKFKTGVTGRIRIRVGIRYMQGYDRG